MKLAVLIQCHKAPEQVNMLLEALNHPQIDCYVHVDKKSDIEPKLLQRDNVYFVPDKEKIDVQWAQISQVDATLSLLKMAYEKADYDYYWVCSGQDFPLKSNEEIILFFESHEACDFVELFKSKNNEYGKENNYDKRNAIYFPMWMLGNKLSKRIVKKMWVSLSGGYGHTFRVFRRKDICNMKFYFGSSWVCLSKRTWAWCKAYLAEQPDYYRYFSNCNCPDESFFQTLVMNSPYASKREDYLHYVDWSEGKSSPRVLTCEDEQALTETPKLMARKFDFTVDQEIFKRILRRINSEKN